MSYHKMKGKDLAKFLGVSESTISMVLNNKPGISEKRRIEILKKIEKLNTDKSLKRTALYNNTIGFVVYKRHGKIILEAPFYELLIESVSNTLKENGYNLAFLQFDKNNMNSSLEQMKKSGCCAFVIFAVEMFEDDLEILKTIDKPFVIVDNNFKTEDLDMICVNNELGIKKGLEYLISLGHKNIGYIKSKVEANTFLERIEFFNANMKKLNININEDNIFSLNYSEIDAYNEMKKKIKNIKKMPTALMADNDLLAFAAIRAIQDCGYMVPEDISVLGFDDRPVCVKSNPQITTISVPKYIMGLNSVKLLIDRIDKKREESIKLFIGVNLIIRESVSPPKKL